MAFVEWDAFRAHREQVIADHGEWWGMLDNHQHPITDLPAPTESSWGKVWNEPTEMSASFDLIEDGVVHPMVDPLVGEGLARVDEQGQLIPTLDESLFVAVERPGVRAVYRVAFPDVSSQTVDAPDAVTVHGVDELQWVLGALIGPSAPDTWIHGEGWHHLNQDWATTWGKYRWMNDIKMAAELRIGVRDGRADRVIRQVIVDGVRVAEHMYGRSLPIYVSPYFSGHESPKILLDVQDRSLWEEVGETAAAAGVTISAECWWPGDDPWRGMTWSEPRVIVSVWQEDI